jgi:hypothetical protein
MIGLAAGMSTALAAGAEHAPAFLPHRPAFAPQHWNRRAGRPPMGSRRNDPARLDPRLMTRC